MPAKGKKAENTSLLPAGAARAKRNRPDHDGTHRQAFERNKKRLLMTQDVCGICGRPIDKTIRYPNPLAPCVDHIVPIDRGGHPSALENLQLAHWICNRQKGNKLIDEQKRHAAMKEKSGKEAATNRLLPQSRDWTAFHATGNKGA